MTAHNCGQTLATTDAPAWRAMKAESERTGLPEAYATDLDHDADYIARQQPAAFVWILRPCGTHIIARSADTAGPLQHRHHTDRLYSVRDLDIIASHFYGHRFYTWDGRTLTQVTLDAAKDFLRTVAA